MTASASHCCFLLALAAGNADRRGGHLYPATLLRVGLGVDQVVLLALDEPLQAHGGTHSCGGRQWTGRPCLRQGSPRSLAFLTSKDTNGLQFAPKNTCCGRRLRDNPVLGRRLVKTNGSCLLFPPEE